MISIRCQDDGNTVYNYEGDTLERYQQRFARLTIQQLDAILLFLRWLRQEHAGETSNSLLSKAEMSVMEILGSRG